MFRVLMLTLAFTALLANAQSSGVTIGTGEAEVNRYKGGAHLVVKGAAARELFLSLTGAEVNRPKSAGRPLVARLGRNFHCTKRGADPQPSGTPGEYLLDDVNDYTCSFFTGEYGDVDWSLRQD